jgi:hypothetical protein
MQHIARAISDSAARYGGERGRPAAVFEASARVFFWPSWGLHNPIQGQIGKNYHFTHIEFFLTHSHFSVIKIINGGFFHRSSLTTQSPVWNRHFFRLILDQLRKNIINSARYYI